MARSRQARQEKKRLMRFKKTLEKEVKIKCIKEQK